MEALMRGAVERFGAIDLLACCAGIQTYGTAEDTEEAVWDRTLAVNLKGCYLASRYAIPEMRKRGGGAIVHVSSVQGLACQTQAAPTRQQGRCHRAHALDGARFAKDRIRVNAVCPGAVDTPMLRASAAKFAGGVAPWTNVLREWGESHPLGKGYGRVCTAAEVAEVIVFLLSDRRRS
jgi:NAD(P)-dependent dehydrogenase (short-subunit alcohol dehydrogenase family)